MHDLVIRNGLVVDGNNEPAKRADIAIDGDTITAVGAVSQGRREIDAQGQLVTPGFVDMHTHYDAQVTWDPYLTPSSWHGCTTVVMGSCGVGFAPVAPDRRDWLIGLMEGVEDIPGAALTEGIEWDWESFPEYLDALETRERTIDFATQIPHGAVRAYVMGERGADNEDATADDLRRMADIVEGGIRAGALGFSTSRTSLHKAIDGRYVPGTLAPSEELRAIAGAIRSGGGGVFQFACEHKDVPQELDIMSSISTDYDLPVMFNLSQFDQAPELWRDVETRLAEINAGPASVLAQVAGRAIGIIMSWQATAHPFALKPSWLAMESRPWSDKREALHDPSFRQRLMDEDPVFVGEFESFVTQSFHKMFLVRDGYEPSPEDSIAAQAAARGCRPEEIAIEALMEFEGEGMLYFPLFNYSNGHLDALEQLHQSPWTRLGLSDAGAHCGAICDGGMPTFMLTHWARDRQRGGRLPLEWIIHRQTAQTAAAFGLNDRGLLKPGYRADVNIIDFDNLQLGRPRLIHDLPAGGRRLIQRASGYTMTMAGGVIISENDNPTGAFPGRLIRGQKSAPGA